MLLSDVCYVLCCAASPVLSLLCCLWCFQVTEDLETQISRNKQMHADFIAIEKELKFKNIETGRLTTEKNILERKVSFRILK